MGTSPKDHLALVFPNLASERYRITSSATNSYNCIAWAAGRVDRWWWPAEDGHWPPGIPREATVEAFVTAFSTLGYAICKGAGLEPGFEKIALYTDSKGEPTHAARQLPGGSWSSKLGPSVDIEHATPHGVGGDRYGSPAVYLRRPALRGVV